jgi:hypothetical protein
MTGRGETQAFGENPAPRHILSAINPIRIVLDLNTASEVRSKHLCASVMANSMHMTLIKSKNYIVPETKWVGL